MALPAQLVGVLEAHPPACDLTIELDPSTTVPRAGEEIEGQLWVRAREYARCEALTVALICTTGSKRDRETEVAQELTLFHGRWQPGDQVSYPFRVRLPVHPWSYQGEVLKVGWSLVARAKLDRADITTEAALHVAPPTQPSVVVIPCDNSEPERRWAGSCLLTSLGLLLGSVGVFLGWREVWGLGSALSNSVLLAALGVVGLSVSLPRYLATRRLGFVRVRVGPPTRDGYREAGRQDELVCTVVLRPDADIRRATATFMVVEQAHAPQGVEGMLRHVIYEQRAELTPRGEAGSLPPGDHEVYSGRFRLPLEHDVPLPWASSCGGISWEVEAHVELGGWSDFKETLQLDVRPGSSA